MPLVGDGVADDTAALQALIDAVPNGGVVELPAGTFRTTSDLKRRATGAFSAGVKLRGKHVNATKIIADYNGDVTLGSILRFDTPVISNYTMNSEISDLTITQVPGRTGLNGIQLTAAWFVHLHDIKIDGLSGSGLIASLRTDIHPTISDYYQSFAVDMERLFIRSCTGWGIKFGAGQSPGLYRLSRSMIYGNWGGGILSTTGQCEIVGNAIAENGFGGGGGILFDTTEGPSMVADVRQNEIDCNFNYNMWLRRSRGIRVTQNRFLHCGVNDPASYTRVSGGLYMRPAVGALLGDDGMEVTRALFEQNLHRSVTGPNKTSAPVSHYKRKGNGQHKLNRLWYNDIDGTDGLVQNSAGSIKFDGFAGTDVSIIDGSGAAPPPSDVGTTVVKARTATPQDVYGTITAIKFEVEDVDPDGQFNLYYFRPAVTADYLVNFQTRIKNLYAGQGVQAQIWMPSSNTAAFTKMLTASGIAAGENFLVSQQLKLTANVLYAFCITISWPSKPLDVSDAMANYLEIKKVT